MDDFEDFIDGFSFVSFQTETDLIKRFNQKKSIHSQQHDGTQRNGTSRISNKTCKKSRIKKSKIMPSNIHTPIKSPVIANPESSFTSHELPPSPVSPITSDSTNLSTVSQLHHTTETDSTCSTNNSNDAPNRTDEKIQLPDCRSMNESNTSIVTVSSRPLTPTESKKEPQLQVQNIPVVSSSKSSSIKIDPPSSYAPAQSSINHINSVSSSIKINPKQNTQDQVNNSVLQNHPQVFNSLPTFTDTFYSSKNKQNEMNQNKNNSGFLSHSKVPQSSHQNIFNQDYNIPQNQRLYIPPIYTPCNIKKQNHPPHYPPNQQSIKRAHSNRMTPTFVKKSFIESYQPRTNGKWCAVHAKIANMIKSHRQQQVNNIAIQTRQANNYTQSLWRPWS